MLFAHFHPVFLQHRDYLSELKLTRLVFVKVLEDLNDVLVTINLIKSEHSLCLCSLRAPTLEPVDDDLIF